MSFSDSARAKYRARPPTRSVVRGANSTSCSISTVLLSRCSPPASGEARPRPPFWKQQAGPSARARGDEASHEMRHIDLREITAGEGVGEDGAPIDSARALVQNHHCPAAEGAEPTSSGVLSPKADGADFEADRCGDPYEFRQQPVGRHAGSLHPSLPSGAPCKPGPNASRGSLEASFAPVCGERWQWIRVSESPEPVLWEGQ